VKLLRGERAHVTVVRLRSSYQRLTGHELIFPTHAGAQDPGDALETASVVDTA
jgi:hypothetical protein